MRQPPKTAARCALRWIDKRGKRRQKVMGNAYSWRGHVRSILSAGATDLQVQFSHRAGWGPWRSVHEYGVDLLATPQSRHDRS